MGEQIQIELGKKYRDAITDFQGTATAITYKLGGQTMVVLEGPAGETRNRAEGEYFDAFRLTLVSDQAVDLGFYPSDTTVTHTDQLIGSSR